jgi:hypothetical protein
MYRGWFAFGGNEIANVSRTFSYVRHMAPGMPLRQTIREMNRSAPLADALGDERYESPLLDRAPWVNEFELPTQDFYGFIPLSIDGVDGSTRTATVTQLMQTGGAVGDVRHASREIRVSGLLVGATAEAIEAGQVWLSGALESAECGSHGSGCGVSDFLYFTALPPADYDTFNPIETSTTRLLLGPISKATSPMIYDFHQLSGVEVSEATPQQPAWRLRNADIPAVPQLVRDGTIITYGRMERYSSRVIWASEQLQLQRTNWMPNADFDSASPLSFLEAESGTITRIDNGGVDDLGAYLSVDGPAPHIVFPASQSFFGPSIGSVYLRGAGTSVTMRLYSNADDVLQGEDTFALTGNWGRYYVSTSLGRDLRMELTATGDFEMDKVLLESGNLLLDFFDGNTPSTPDYEVSWLGAANASGARRVWDHDLADYGDGLYDSGWRPFLTVLQGGLNETVLELPQFERISIEDQLASYERMVHDVVCTSGPNVIRDMVFDQGFARQVDFIFTAENPWRFGGTEMVWESTGAPSMGWTDQLCEAESYLPIQDPSLPPVPTPPTPPSIPGDGVDTSITSWTRRRGVIAKSFVPSWTDVVPTVEILTGSTALRNARVRFFPNPFEWPIADIDPCSYCAEFIVSYIPSQTNFVVNGMMQRAFAEVAGRDGVPADHLLYGTDGTPMSWPELTCAIPYVVTVDVPSGTASSALETVTISVNRRE